MNGTLVAAAWMAYAICIWSRTPVALLGFFSCPNHDTIPLRARDMNPATDHALALTVEACCCSDNFFPF